MHLIEPVFHMSKSPQQFQPRLGQFELRFQRIQIFLPFINPRLLPSLRRKLRLPAATVAVLQLRLNRLQLVSSNLLFETSNLRLRIQLPQRSGKLRNLQIILVLSLIRLHPRSQSLCSGFTRLRTINHIQQRYRHIDS
jgi:hypothetical protein